MADLNRALNRGRGTAFVAGQNVELDSKGLVSIIDLSTGRLIRTTPVSASESIRAGIATLVHENAVVVDLVHPTKGAIRVASTAVAEYEKRGYVRKEKANAQTAAKDPETRRHPLIGLKEPRGEEAEIAKLLSGQIEGLGVFDEDAFAAILATYDNPETGNPAAKLSEVPSSKRANVLADMRITIGLDPNTGKPFPGQEGGTAVGEMADPPRKGHKA